jgi:serine/threonine protein kinase
MTENVLRTLQLPFEALRTIYAGGAEVRLYRNTVTNLLEVGKRVDTLGLGGAMLVREARWLSRIHHDNLVPVKSVAVVADPVAYPPPLEVIEMVMPYYRRGSVADALFRGEQFSIAQARDHILAALRGLGELHEVERVIHRDFKSPNLLLTDDPSLAVVSDLGVAAPMEPDGSVEGYPNAQLYSPPEAFVTNRVDKRADLYAAGLLLFEMVNGPLPWSEYDDRLAMATRLSGGKPAALPRHLRCSPHVPAEMRRLIARSLSGDPARRPPDTAAMATELSRIRLVDWSLVDHEDDLRTWHGRSVVQADRTYVVEARRQPGYGWRLSGVGDHVIPPAERVPIT